MSDRKPEDYERAMKAVVGITMEALRGGGMSGNTIERLRKAGLFVRHYDAVTLKRLPKAIEDLHRELCQIGQPADLLPWLNMPVGQLLEIYARGTGMNWFEWLEEATWRDSKDEE